MTRPDDALRPREVARMTGISIGRLRELRQQRRGPQFIRTPGGHARYLRCDVQRWIRENTVETAG